MKYDELIKHLRYCGTHDCAGEAEELIGCMAMWSDRDCKNCNAVLQLDAADAIEELQAQLPKWISVTERLPSACTYVLISYQTVFGQFCDVTYIDNRGKWKGFQKGRVTHWMPLPSTEGLYET